MNFSNNKTKIIALHCVAWLVIFSLPYLLSPNYSDNVNKDPDAAAFVTLNTLTGIFWVITFYLTVFVFVEKFIIRKSMLHFRLRWSVCLRQLCAGIMCCIVC